MSPSMAEPKGLGRIAVPDLDDLRYLLRARRPAAFEVPVEKLPATLTYERGPILDQGQTGTCVAHSLVSKLNGLPIACLPPRSPAPFALYDQAIVLDEFPGNDHDTERQMGTSVRAGCKALQALGLITEYHWAYDVDEILQWVLGGHGGLVLGIEWRREMGNPSPEGIIRVKGRVDGGHAIYAFGADRARGLLDLQQSWGEAWGGWTLNGERVNPGCCRLPLDDLRKLLDSNGEAVAIVEAPLPVAA